VSGLVLPASDSEMNRTLPAFVDISMSGGEENRKLHSVAGRDTVSG
jgi:hypothetical protein